MFTFSFSSLSSVVGAHEGICHGASWGAITIDSLVAASAVGAFVRPLVAMEERIMRNSILLFAVVVLAVVIDAAHARMPAPILRFGNHGSFKIVQV